MSGDTLTNLAYIAAAVLLPLIPAYILYRALPARGELKGPLGKFTLKFSGAFAGYFALVIIIFGFIYSRPKSCPDCPVCSACPKCPPPRFAVYKVQGQLKLNPDEDFTKNTSLTLQPRAEIRSDGYFEFDVPVNKDESSVKSLEIKHAGFATVTIPLKEKPLFPPQYPVKYDDSNETILIPDLIELQKELKPYSGGEKLTPNSSQ